MLSVDDLLLGAGTTHVVAVPAHVLHPADAPGPAAGGTDGNGSAGGAADGNGSAGGGSTVVIRPLVLADVQRIHKAAQESNVLTSVLMVSQALVEPKASVDEVGRMHAGLVEFLLGEVNRVSGLSLAGDGLDDAVQAPLARACFVLAREFGWTPEECSGLTLGQILLYVEMLGRGEVPCSRPR